MEGHSTKQLHYILQDWSDEFNSTQTTRVSLHSILSKRSNAILRCIFSMCISLVETAGLMIENCPLET